MFQFLLQTEKPIIPLEGKEDTHLQLLRFHGRRSESVNQAQIEQLESQTEVLGIPWDVDSKGLEEYMSKFGKLEDCVVMKEHTTGRSRGFGYVTFSSADDAKGALESEHVMGNRTLEVKIATPKEEMRQSSINKKATRIFVARIPQSVDESMFRNHFETYGDITDLYMPKEPHSKGHRGIGFITYQSPESVDMLMNESHELGGSSVVVDRATPKEEDMRYPSRAPSYQQGGYGAYSAYISAATRYGALGAPTLYDHPASAFGRTVLGPPARGLGKKLFIGRLPQEANSEDLREYFSRFGRVIDAYIPKDPKKSGHRGFGFVTFADDGVADRVARRSHEIRGQEVLIDTAAPLEVGGGSGRERDRDRDRDRDRERDRDRGERDRERDRERGILGSSAGVMGGGYMDAISALDPFGVASYGPMRSFGRLYGAMPYDAYGYGYTGNSSGDGGGGGGGTRAPRDSRYRPY